ncbi:MAG TPA: TlpA disulfide reductase family protein, partial [Niabella sp.]|nr:TlpA disulfide reductase family protein [Niabella sp.]
LPDKLLSDLKKKKTKDSLALQTYIAKYSPSATYITVRNIELKYDILQRFYKFKGNHKFKLRRRPDFESLYALWQQAETDLRKAIPMSDEKALISPDYIFFVRNFLLREKEALWEMEQKEPNKFYKEWYATENAVEGAKLMREDPENLLTEKIINKYFSGAVAEFAYAHLISSRIGDKEDNLLAIYSRFRQSYPNSLYLARLDSAIQILKEKDSRVLSDKMIFVKDMDSLTSFEEIKALVKGETVLLDMWGTWCGPCRKEINENSEALKKHFKERKVRFLYVSNFDTGKEALWKKLIAYYRLEGTHILANAQLTKSIMSTVKGTGYPTYVIIKKDGSFELSKAGYPMDRKKLIRQIEDAL